ncbi:CLUMA_CG009084, isoform A [Clunio marinus]|uniref:CLUMA_CG009084, isoform A n=1 Tax=Clunio marinus TaxID=568069 RepID=A0A1J1I799_9DIPT|nr:CLUMA_CG009084, isoform A [Clunio marinus]
MDLSLVDLKAMDDSFILTKSEAMDDEVTQIIKKWNLSAKKENSENINRKDAFDSRTFTRPKKNLFNQQQRSIPHGNETDDYSIESGIASINLKVGGAMSSFNPRLVQRTWLSDVSPPSSISTSISMQNNDNMLNSLITSSDFSNVSFLLNTSDDNDATYKANPTVLAEKPDSAANVTRNLINFTFDVDKTMPLGATFTQVDTETPIKEFGIENGDFYCPPENFGNNLTFDAHENSNERALDQFNETVIQSTPVLPIENENEHFKKNFELTVSPINSLRDDFKNDDGESVALRKLKSRKLIDDITIEDYRISIEDQCEFLLNEETIKLSSRVYGDSMESSELKSTLQKSADSNEKDFDRMLESFSVKKSMESEKLLQSIKQRHSQINFEKQREEKQKRDGENDNKIQYESMNQKSQRLLQRSRLYDDVNVELQKQSQEIFDTDGAKTSTKEQTEPEENESVDTNNRDRFKTIKLNKKLQSGMVVVDTEEPIQPIESNVENSTSPGSNKERRNQLNQQTQDKKELKKPAPPSKLSKFGFGFTRPTYKSQNELQLTLKASSTDSLDNNQPKVYNHKVPNLKSPMGVKSKSIHNLMYNGGSNQNGSRLGSNSNLKLTTTTKSQSNLKFPRASSLVRQMADNGIQSSSNTFSNAQMRPPPNRKGIVRPSSGYYGNTFNSKRFDSDESGCSLSSSSASSRNSVHLSGDQYQQQNYQKPINSSEELSTKSSVTGTIPKPTGLRPPSSLRMPQARSGLPRPAGIMKR